MNVTKVSIGLGNVDNTSDRDKPVSKRLQPILDRKADVGHVHDSQGGVSLATVKADTDIASAISLKHASGSDNQDLSGKANTTHSHVPSDVTGTAVITNDARLSDARTPLTHTHSYEPANANIQTHVGSAHAPSNAQANADITKAEIEAKLTGAISTHSHSGGSDGETTVIATQDTPNATVNLANATGLTFTALANSTYIIEVFLVWASSLATVGIKVTATATNSPTIQAGHFMSDAVSGTPDSSSWNANDVVVTTSGSPFTTNNLGIVNAIIKTGASASVWQLRFAAETTGTVTVKTGSVIRYRKV